jgi:Na+-transporting NADH:ubiquinone oxidoreductase subunit NqrF
MSATDNDKLVNSPHDKRIMVCKEVAKRQAVERRVCRKLITEAIKAGYTVTVHNGEEVVCRQSVKVLEILGEMFSVDEERLYFHDAADGARVGCAVLIYGNDGWDVINDYGAPSGSKLELVFDAALEFAESLDS